MIIGLDAFATVALAQTENTDTALWKEVCPATGIYVVIEPEFSDISRCEDGN